MKRRMSTFKDSVNSLVGKTLFCTISITMAVLMTTSVVLFFWFRSQMTKEYQKLTNATIANIEVVFDYYMDNTKNMMVQWFYSSDGTVCRLSNDNNVSSNMPLLLNVQNVIGNIPFIHSLYFLGENREVVFETGTGISYTKDLSDVLPEKLALKKNVVKPFIWLAQNRYQNKDDVALLTMYCWETPLESPRFTGAAVVNLDAGELSRSLFSEKVPEDLEIFIMDESGNIICHSGMEYYGQNWSDREDIKKILAGEEHVFKASQDDRLIETSWIKSMQSGFYIVAQSEYVNGIHRFNTIANVVFVVMLAAAAIIIAFTWPLCRLIYKPLNSMISDIRKKIAMEDHGYNEIQVLNQYYEQLAEDILQLNENEEKNFIVKNLLLDNQIDTVQNLLLKNRMISVGRGYFLVLAYLTDDKEKALSMQEYDMMRKIVSDIFSSNLGNLGCCTYFEISLRKMLFLLSEADEQSIDGSELLSGVKQIRRSAEDLIHNKVVIYLSDRYLGDCDNCVPAFKEAEERLKTRSILEENAGTEIGHYNQAGAAEQMKAAEKHEKEFLVCAKKRDREKYIKTLEALLDNCKDVRYKEFIAFMVKLSLEVLQLKGKKLKTEDSEEQEKKLRQQLEGLSLRREYIEWFDVLFQEADVKMEQINSYSTANQMSDAVDYIRNNYDDSMLNVNMLADKMNISAPYFGKLFKEFTGCTALEYITRTRMEKAHDLLLTEPDKDISKIASAVGYSNNAYFATAFKKYFGVSPSKLRDYHAVSGIKTDSDE